MLWLSAIFTGLAFLVGNGFDQAGWGVTFGFAAALCALIWFNAPAENAAEPFVEYPDSAATGTAALPEPAPEPTHAPPAQWGWDDDLSDIIGPTHRAQEAW
jgi:hypothetical protein